ncbi:SPOR domain-containing protein [Halioxenophilus aromaticivorans]|uniref:SPOR domain-containing protein n=1 Tax=Halioxenophilus aromaticivorans TaxID=1306992 RepID=A0AAV3U7V8_9ALTE
MDSGGKQRVIGACVLVAVGVLFLPVLLDRSQEQVIDTQTQIPAKPDFTLYNHKAPTQPPNSTPPPNEERLFLPEPEEAAAVEEAQAKPESNPAADVPAEEITNSKPVVVEAEQNGLDANGLPKSWVVQVASFTEDERAKKLVATLLADDYRAYSRRVVRGDKALYRVYVGPSINREAALKLKSALDDKLNADTLVLKLTP